MLVLTLRAVSHWHEYSQRVLVANTRGWLTASTRCECLFTFTRVKIPAVWLKSLGQLRWYRYRETAWELAANDERDTDNDLQKSTNTVTKNSLVKVQVYSRPTILPKNLSKPVSTTWISMPEHLNLGHHCVVISNLNRNGRVGRHLSAPKCKKIQGRWGSSGAPPRNPLMELTTLPQAP